MPMTMIPDDTVPLPFNDLNSEYIYCEDVSVVAFTLLQHHLHSLVMRNCLGRKTNAVDGQDVLCKISYS